MHIQSDINSRLHNICDNIVYLVLVYIYIPVELLSAFDNYPDVMIIMFIICPNHQ